MDGHDIIGEVFAVTPHLHLTSIKKFSESYNVNVISHQRNVSCYFRKILGWGIILYYMEITIRYLTSSVSTWKALPSLLNNIWVSIALKIGGHVTIGEATIEKVWSGSREERNYFHAKSLAITFASYTFIYGPTSVYIR